jgi:hypothetical protein
MTQPAGISPAVPKPDHVPDSVVFDFDYFEDPGLKQDAHGRALEVVRDAPPIFWSPRNGGQWVLKSHDAVFKASRDPDRFSNEFVPW